MRATVIQFLIIGATDGEVQVAHLEVGPAVEIVGAHILTDDADEHLVSYLATGVSRW